MRAQQIVQSTLGTGVAACNFCSGMFNLGLGPLTPEDHPPIEVKDIADLVASGLA